MAPQGSTSESITGDNSNRSTLRRELQTSSKGFVSFVFSLLGLGLLVPWNAFISAKPYFESRICSKLAVQGNIEVLISLVFTSSSVLSLFLMITYQTVKDRFLLKQQQTSTTTGAPTTIDGPLLTNPSNEEASYNHNWYMVCLPLFIYFTVFGALALLVFFPAIPALVFYIFMIASLAICGIMVAVASAGVVSTANRFPPNEGIAHFFSGQAIGGVAVSGAQFLAAVFADHSVYWESQCEAMGQLIDVSESNSHGATTCVPYTKVDWPTFVYFFLGSLVLGSCIIGYNEIDKYLRKKVHNNYESVQDISEDVEEESPCGTSDFPFNQSPFPTTNASNDNEIEAENNVSLAGPTTLVWNEVKGPATCIFLVFLVTLAVFPAWTSTLKSTHQCESQHPLARLSNDLYIPATFVIFNLGDLTGRLLAERMALHTIIGLSTKLVIFASFRGVFFGLFLLCAANKSAIPSIPSDFFSLSVQFLFAMSNGGLISAAFMHASNLVPNTAEMQARSSEILSFALSFGLLCGSLLSFFYTNLASGDWW